MRGKLGYDFLSPIVLFFVLIDRNMCLCSIKYASFWASQCQKRTRWTGLLSQKTLPMGRKLYPFLYPWLKGLGKERAQSFSTRRVFLQFKVKRDQWFWCSMDWVLFLLIKWEGYFRKIKKGLLHALNSCEQFLAEEESISIMWWERHSQWFREYPLFKMGY